MGSFDGTWEALYSQDQQINRYPWTEVVSFIFRHKPDCARKNTNILEVGCGTAPNIAFLAEEGFNAFGLDASPSAIKAGQALLEKRGLMAELSVGDFTVLQHGDSFFDIVIDRAALTHADFPSMSRAIGEIHRVLKPGGKFLFTPFADSHTSFAKSVMKQDQTSYDLTGGKVAGVGQVTFISRKEIASLFRDGWRLVQCVRREDVDLLGDGDILSQWFVIVEKI